MYERAKSKMAKSKNGTNKRIKSAAPMGSTIAHEKRRHVA